ncbi:MAG TPA: hypothetical protein VK951_03065 [Miltoncostaeaceae bacterium]|nr:hypothetical protein [Miltoncostaeaceae bacterium]
MVRHVLLVQMDTAKANDLVRSGKLGETIGTILAEQKPEAVYFTELDGVRTGIMIIDIAAESDIPQIAEPWFLALDAKLSFRPAMVPADLEAAGPAFAAAVKTYG